MPQDPATLELVAGEILGDPSLGRELAVRFSPELRRAQAFGVLDAFIRQSAEGGPLVVVFEDVHWADPTTIEWLERLSRELVNIPVLLLMTSRPMDRATALSGSDVTTLTLRPLTVAQARALIAAQPGSAALTEDHRGHIARKAEGVPLFLEELLKASVSLPDPDEVPDTLMGALRARFDVFGQQSSVVEAASIFGQSFDLEDVAAVLEVAPRRVKDALEQIRETRVVVPAFGAGEGRFQFRHALLRDFAYAQLTTDRLATLHRRAAACLERKPGTQPILVAEHLAASGQISEAASQFLRSAALAVGRAANREVIDICEGVLALLSELPSPVEQIKVELNARLLLGVAMQALYGYSAAGVLENYRRAQALCEIAGSRAELFPVLRGLYVYKLLAGKLREADRLALQLIDLADRSNSREHFIESRFALGQIKIYHRNDIDNGLFLLQAAANRYEIADSPLHVSTYGQDPGVFSLALSLFPMVAMGRFDDVRHTILQAQDLADRVGHPMSHAAALVFSSWAWNMMGDHDRGALYAERARDMGTQQLLPMFEFWGDLMHAVATGTVDPAIQKLGFYDHVGMAFTIVIIVPMLAEAALAGSGVDLASDVNRRALDLLATGEDEPCMSAEAFRVAARIDAAQGNFAARDAWLERAWSAAEATGSHFFSLRCASAALEFDGADALWQSRLKSALKRVSPQLPNVWRERLESLVD